MAYSLEYSQDRATWSPVIEGDRPVKRERLQDIQREAEFHSYHFPLVRIVHP